MSLKRLIYQLKNNNQNYIKLLSNYNNSDWIHHAKFNKYAYHSIPLFQNNKVFLKLITWMPGQETNVHNHYNYEHCYFKILNNQLTEYLYDSDLTHLNTKIHKYNDIAFCDYNKYHKITNNSENNSVSLHLYVLHDQYNECQVKIPCFDEVPSPIEIANLKRRLII